MKRLLTILCVTIFSTLIGACSSTLKHISTEYRVHTSMNLWDHLASQFRYKKSQDQPLVKEQIQFIRHNPSYILNLTKNAQPYIYYVYKQVEMRHMPIEVTLLPMIESGYNPFLFSHQGATGLWQLMPGTATGLGLNINWWYDSRRDIVASTDAALNYLSYLHHFFNDWELAIAAYNAGEGTVLEAIQYNRKHHKPTDIWHLSLPAETKTYLPKLLAIAAVLRHPSLIQHRIHFVKNTPYLKIITIKKQYNLSVLANLTNTSETTLRNLNPGFRRFSTGPGPYSHFLLPASHFATFTENLKTYKGKNISWHHHSVITGDNLSSLAQRYHTNVGIIKEVNHLKDDDLKLNQVLLIPVSLRHSTPLSASTNQKIAEDNLPGPSLINYTVKAKDTIDGIAKQFNVSVREIKYWNHLQSPYIRIGRKITLWKKHYIPGRSSFIHTVRGGDSLSTIAKRFNVSVLNIKKLNQLHGNLIHVNQKLRIPYPKAKHYHPKFRNQLVIHRVKPGDSISSLAHYYRVSKEVIRHLNHLHKDQLLQLGQPIKIYFSS